MKHSIKLSTYSDQTGEALISKALGFKSALSLPTIIDLFSDERTHRSGVFKSKKAALLTASRINKRAAFGGFGMNNVIAEVTAA